jgi:type VI secretion system secreted protein VgrG
MPIVPIDANRGLKIDSPLGGDLICRSFNGQDKLGRLFDYRLDLLSLNTEIQFDDIVGQRVTVSMELENGERYFDGYVTEFRYAGTLGQFAWYQATVRPWFWFLTRTSDCRIFQNQKVPDIIKAVFRDNGMSDFKDMLSGSYREWVYCVQYRETDFNFISRLMEQEGIYYYFEHEKGKHTLVLADGLGAHQPFPGYETVPYFPPDPNAALRERDHIQHWTVTQAIVPGKYAIKDFDFEKPKVDLTAKLSDPPTHDYPISDHEIYDYPGEYNEVGDGNTYVKRKLEELKAQQERVQAGGSARGMSAGCLFTLENFGREDQNKEYLVISVSHDLKSDPLETSSGSGGEDFYSCRLEVMDSSQQYRSERITPKPIVQGPQTAMVVGPSGEEIYCDEYARVKVQFHWDRYGNNDQDSSCWVRVSQAWAGKNWGAIHIPRIGQEVLVSFLEGDPDQPLITGRVYNAINMPPYELEANKTQSGIKSRSSKGGSENNFNEFRFEDKKNKEEVYFQAEKDLNSLVKNKETRKVKNSRTSNVGEMHTYPPPNDPIVENMTVHADRSTTIMGNDVLSVAQEMAATTGREVTIHNGDHKLEVSKGNQETKVSMGNKTTTVSMGNIKTEASLGKTEETALQSIEMKVGANSIKIDQAGVHIKGIMINIEGMAITTIKGGFVKIN